MDGIIVIDKPEKMTSHDVVAKVRRITGQKKCGHTGTLDPMASGILICCLGKATRLVQFISDGMKRYQATISIGAATDSYDRDGQLTYIDEEVSISKEAFLEVLSEFTGHISQMPPMYSAVHHEGKRLYELAREGITVERKAREIYIEKISIINYDHIKSDLKFNDTLTLDIICSKGTYIRSLAHDILIRLHSYGHLVALRRTENAGFVETDATKLDELSCKLGESLHPLIKGVDCLEKLEVTDEEINKVQHGMCFPRKDLMASDGMISLVKGTSLIAIADNSDEELIKPKIVLGDNC